MRLCSCMDPYRVRPVAQGEIKNRCTIGRLFCIIRKRGGGKKERESFPTDIRDPFSAFSVWYFAACVFFLLFFSTLSLEWFINRFFFFSFCLQLENASSHSGRMVSGGGRKLSLSLSLLPFSHESLWKLKGCLGGTQEGVTVIWSPIARFSGPKAVREGGEVRTLFAQKRSTWICDD